VQETRALIEKASDEDLRKIWTLKFDGKTVFSMPRIAVLRGAVMNHLNSSPRAIERLPAHGRRGNSRHVRTFRRRNEVLASPERLTRLSRQ